MGRARPPLVHDPGLTGECGGATVLAVAACGVLATVGVTLAVGGAGVVQRHRLERSADATAVAAAIGIGTAAEPCERATEVAEANGVELIDCVIEPRSPPAARSGYASVRVRAGVQLPLVRDVEIRASARAERCPARVDPGTAALRRSSRPAVAPSSQQK
jgi:secretion/DNA translocation related TadE-like protein